MEKAQALKKEIARRVESLPVEISRRFESSTSIVVFGSFAAGLEQPKSDLDIFCLGESRLHYKTRSLELLILPEYDVYSELWLGSELANHIVGYGIALDCEPDWFRAVEVSEASVRRKAVRIQTYMRSLENYWERLSYSMHLRYEVKIRRELQRLSYLSTKQAVPPTRMLDEANAKSKSIKIQLAGALAHEDQARIARLFPNLDIEA